MSATIERPNVSLSLLECRKGSPVRPPDWRWRLAEICVNNNYAFEKRNVDDWCAKVVRMRRIMAKYKEEVRVITAVVDSEGQFGYDLLDAYSIHRQPDSPTGTEIEARLLARQTPEEISQICGIDPNIITAYEATFFNVTDRLHNSSWVANCVLGRDFHSGLTERDWQALWRLYGYFGGPALFTALQMKQNMQASPDDEKVEAQLRSDRRRSLLLKENMAARTMQVNGFTQVPIMEMGLRNTDLEHKLATGNTDEIATALESLMKVVCFRMVEQADKPKSFEPRSVGLLAGGEELTVDWTDNPFNQKLETVNDTGAGSV